MGGRNLKIKLTLLIFMLISITIFSGCSKLDSLQVKMGIKNNDFEYVKQGKVKTIIIKNVRDNGFRFVVTDPKTISDMYDRLSSAKPVSTKSSLKPDYIFELHEGPNKIYTFNYIAGIDKKDGGNLYSDNKIYIISKRIDTDIIKNFSDVRTPPKDFNKIYYRSILQAADKYRKSSENSNKVIGINLNEDLDAAKFILSIDLEDFKKSLPQNTLLMENRNETVDTVQKVVTEGYKRDLYKSIITFTDKKTNKEVKYYIRCDYKDIQWKVDIQEKPQEGF